MSETKDLKRIKKLYGEKFMHLCRELFPSILEQEGLLPIVLESCFEPNTRTLYEDIASENLFEEFQSFVFEKVDVEKDKIEVIEKKSPYEILDKAGYNLYECTTEKEIQRFKKYYKKNEELCTFNGGRLDRCVVFWAVKKNVEDIKREDFDKPQRDDEYGTSVMSIQFSKGKNCFVSIKNRYNHTVNNADATYGNNLDKIAEGLTKSFSDLLEERKMYLDSSNIDSFNLKNNYIKVKGKYYKYNMEANGIYYCPNNIIIDNGEVIRLEPEKKELFDYFIIDKENKTISVYDWKLQDGFLKQFGKIEKIEEVKDNTIEKGAKKITIKNKNSSDLVEIEIDKENNIIGLKNDGLINTGNNFLEFNHKLRKFEADNLKNIGDKCLENNEEMESILFQKVERIGNNFCIRNKKIAEIIAPKVKKIGDNFCEINNKIKSLTLESVEEIGDYFLGANLVLEALNMKNVKKIGKLCCYCNMKLEELYFENLVSIGMGGFRHNNKIKKFIAPNLKVAEKELMLSNSAIEELSIPSIRILDIPYLNFLPLNNLKILNMPENQIEYQRLAAVVKGNNGIINGQATNSIDRKDISHLSKEEGIKTSEIGFGRKIIERIKSLFRNKKDNIKEIGDGK